MEIGVMEAARRMGLNDRRVRALIEDGRIPARRVAGRWLIDETQLPLSRPASRPLSPRNAWAMIELLSGGHPAVSPTEAYRLRSKRRQLLESEDAPRLLRSWLAARATRHRVAAAGRDLPALKGDRRVLPSGVSDPRSELSVADEVELYVTSADYRTVVEEFMLSDLGRPNVTLHVAEMPLPAEAPIGLVIADLADWDRPRENRRVLELLHHGADR